VQPTTWYDPTAATSPPRRPPWLWPVVAAGAVLVLVAITAALVALGGRTGVDSEYRVDVRQGCDSPRWHGDRRERCDMDR
jgi:hypothetical protein